MVVNVQGAYCAESDLRTGDLAVPSYRTEVDYVLGAAEEIDAALGHMYVTPFEIDWNEDNPQINPIFRPTVLFLKKLNWLLASGRFVLDVAAAGEMDSLHAYGKRMLDEAMMMLKPVIDGEVILAGAEQIKDPNATDQSSGPLIHNEDTVSLVESFYTSHRPWSGLGEPYPGWYTPPVVPYG